MLGGRTGERLDPGGAGCQLAAEGATPWPVSGECTLFPVAQRFGPLSSDLQLTLCSYGRSVLRCEAALTKVFLSHWCYPPFFPIYDLYRNPPVFAPNVLCFRIIWSSPDPNSL